VCLLLSLLAVLHPQHKLAYFKAQGWEESWVDTAHKIVHEEYDCLYAPANLSVDSEDKYIHVGSVDSVCFFVFLWVSLVTLVHP
jgi:hypothetical protein